MVGRVRLNLPTLLLLTGAVGCVPAGRSTSPEEALLKPVDPGSPGNPNNPGNNNNTGNNNNNGNPGVDPCAEAQPLLQPQLRRLTRTQYENTLEAVFGPIAADDLPSFGDDNPTIGLANDPSKLRITTVSIDSVYASAQAVSEHARSTHRTVIDCLGDSDGACFTEVIDELGSGLWRRPVTDEERGALLEGITEVANETGTRAEQMDFLLQSLLMSPNTLFRTEVGDGPGAMAQLSSYELASLLSYSLWDAPPDAELLTLAASGAIRDPDTLRAQTARLAADPRFSASVAAFFWDYLKLGNIYTVDKIEEFGLDEAAREALAQSALGTLRSKLTPEAKYMSVFEGQDFQLNAGSAPFFGLDGSSLSNDLSPVSTNAQVRDGILTHPAFLSVHAGRGNTGIVKRGVFTLEQLLGFELPDPPDNIEPVPDEELPDFDPERTSTRDILQITHSGQARCRFCHEVIDPAGFGFENFDPVGRFRVEEKQAVPIDASGTYAIHTGEELTFDNSLEYMKTLANSDAMQKTVLEYYFEYVMGQSGGGCEAHRFAERVHMASDSVRALAESIVQTDSFGVRQQ